MTDEELIALFVETGHKHHQAYIESDGADAEWALWYAGYVQTKLWDGLGKLFTRSEIVYLLVRGDREAQVSDDPSQWAAVYARLFREAAAD